MQNSQYVYKKKIDNTKIQKFNNFVQEFKEIEKTFNRVYISTVEKCISKNNIITDLKEIELEDLARGVPIGAILFALSKTTYLNEILNSWQSSGKFLSIIQFILDNCAASPNEITSIFWSLRNSQNNLNQIIEVNKGIIIKILKHGSTKNVNKLLIALQNTPKFLDLIKTDKYFKNIVKKAIIYLEETQSSTIPFDFNQLFLKAILADPSANFNPEQLKEKEIVVENFLQRVARETAGVKNGVGKKITKTVKECDLSLLKYLQNSFNHPPIVRKISSTQYLLKDNNGKLTKISRADPSHLLLNMPKDTFVWIELPPGQPTLQRLCELHVINNEYYITGMFGGSMMKKGKLLAVKLEYLYGDQPTRVQEFLKLCKFRPQFFYFQRFIMAETLSQFPNASATEPEYKVLTGTFSIYHAQEGEVINPKLDFVCEDGCSYMRESLANKILSPKVREYKQKAAKKSVKKHNTAMPYAALQEIKREEQDELGITLYKQSLKYNIKNSLEKLLRSNGADLIVNEIEKQHAKRNLRSLMTTGFNEGFHGVAIPMRGEQNTLLLPTALDSKKELSILRVPCDKMNIKKVEYKKYAPLDEVFILQYSLLAVAEKNAALVGYKGDVVVIPDQYWPSHIKADLIASTEDRKLYSPATDKESIRPAFNMQERVHGVFCPIKYTTADNVIGISSKILKTGMNGDFDGDEINCYTFESANPFLKLITQPVQEDKFWKNTNPKIIKEYKVHDGVLLRLSENQNIQASLVNQFTIYYNAFVALNKTSQQNFAQAFLRENQELVKLIYLEYEGQDAVSCLKLCLATGLKVGTDIFKTNKNIKPFLMFLEQYKAISADLNIPLPIYFKGSLDSLLLTKDLTLENFLDKIYAQKPYYKGGYVYDYVKKFFKNITFEQFMYVKQRWELLTESGMTHAPNNIKFLQSLSNKAVKAHLPHVTTANNKEINNWRFVEETKISKQQKANILYCAQSLQDQSSEAQQEADFEETNNIIAEANINQQSNQGPIPVSSPVILSANHKVAENHQQIGTELLHGDSADLVYDPEISDQKPKEEKLATVISGPYSLGATSIQLVANSARKTELTYIAQQRQENLTKRLVVINQDPIDLYKRSYPDLDFSNILAKYSELENYVKNIISPEHIKNLKTNLDVFYKKNKNFIFWLFYYKLPDNCTVVEYLLGKEETFKQFQEWKNQKMEELIAAEKKVVKINNNFFLSLEPARRKFLILKSECGRFMDNQVILYAVGLADVEFLKKHWSHKVNLEQCFNEYGSMALAQHLSPTVTWSEKKKFLETLHMLGADLSKLCNNGLTYTSYAVAGDQKLLELLRELGYEPNKNELEMAAKTADTHKVV